MPFSGVAEIVFRARADQDRTDVVQGEHSHCAGVGKHPVIGADLRVHQQRIPYLTVLAEHTAPVGIDRAGIVIVEGLNPEAVLEEHGIAAESKAMSTLYEYTQLVPFQDTLSIPLSS